MDLRFSDAEIAFRKEVRDFIARELPAETRERMVAGKSPTKDMVVDWQRKLNAKGWAVPEWPAEWGGPKDWTLGQRYIFREELQQAPAPQPLAFNTNMCGPVIIAFGTEEQKKRFLPRMANLDDWWCQGFSEPGAGSDLAGLKTRAVREGDHYVVNGQKTWTTLGAARRLDLPAGPHRPEREEAGGHLLPASPTCARPASPCGRSSPSRAGTRSTRSSSTT